MLRKLAAASTYPGAVARSTGSPGTWCRRAAGPRPPKIPEPPLGLAKRAQHAVIPGLPRCSGRPKFSSIQCGRKLSALSAATAAGDSAPGGRLARGREAVPLLGVQVRSNLEGRARFEMRAESTGSSPPPHPCSRLEGLSSSRVRAHPYQGRGAGRRCGRCMCVYSREPPARAGWGLERSDADSQSPRGCLSGPSQEAEREQINK